MKKIHKEKVLAVCLSVCCFLTSAHAQRNTLTLNKGRATVKKDFLARKRSDAHFYYLSLRKGQMLDIKIESNAIYLSKENGCGMTFEIFDGDGKQLDLGDSVDGFREWGGEIKETGDYKIKVLVSCLESYSSTDLRNRKLRFKYSLEVLVKT